jgi:hypothetical protein
MKFACLVYDEQSDALSEADLPAIVAKCQGAAAWNEEMRKGGHHVLTAGLQSVRTAKTARNRNGRLSITDGPFAQTKEGLGELTIVASGADDDLVHLGEIQRLGPVLDTRRPSSPRPKGPRTSGASTVASCCLPIH